MALQSTCTAVDYFKSCGFKKNLKLDCSEFGAVEINKAVGSTYNNYQSSPKIQDFSPNSLAVSLGWDPSPTTSTIKHLQVHVTSTTLKMTKEITEGEYNTNTL